MSIIDFFKFKKEKESTNVVPFPTPEVTPYSVPAKKKEPTTFYRIGLTDNNRVSFQMGWSEVTMNKEGCQNLIKQLSVFMDQLPNEDTEEE